MMRLIISREHPTRLAMSCCVRCPVRFYLFSRSPSTPSPLVASLEKFSHSSGEPTDALRNHQYAIMQACPLMLDERSAHCGTSQIGCFSPQNLRHLFRGRDMYNPKVRLGYGGYDWLGCTRKCVDTITLRDTGILSIPNANPTCAVDNSLQHNARFCPCSIGQRAH